MKCLVTGASGFIGSALIDRWLEDESVEKVIALSRSPESLSSRFKGKVAAVGDLKQIADDEAIDCIVNLAGEPILDKRWSEQRKQDLYNSRVGTTEQLLALCRRLKQPPGVLVSGSAIGFYGNQKDDRQLDEQEAGHPCFAHHLCHDWENAALLAEELGIRVCLSRTGVVIGHGGALQRMLLPFRLGLGGPIGHGRQWMSWIDLEDMVNGIDFLVRHETLSGPFNLTAPTPVTNREFSSTLGRSLNRPAFMPMPGMVMELILGEGAELLTEGQRVVPQKLLQAGFEFSYPELQQSLDRHVN
ncbi:MAG: TIGR01777 family oxidoreductase [Motiliproteus sp.]|nr:TIGR01777 family oxidoreductase [Motiliproteus sp.]MCW9051154.1 TIGR01777 family oxidoreductase [Motiliproteus sp.]